MIVFILLLTLFLSRDDEASLYSSVPPFVEEGSGTIVYDLYYESGEKIPLGGPISAKESTYNNLIFSFSNFHSTPQQFGLMIFQNFKQTEFEVDGKTYNIYPFEIDKNSTINIDTKFDTIQNLKELDYIVVENPNMINEDGDIEKALTGHEILTLRYSTTNKVDSTTISLEAQYTESVNYMTDPLLLTNSTKSNDLLVTASSKQEIFLNLYNDLEYDANYAVIAIADGVQVPIMDGQNISYISVPKQWRHTYSINLPNTNKPINYQILAFPTPFNINGMNASGPNSSYSSVIVIQP